VGKLHEKQIIATLIWNHSTSTYLRKLARLISMEGPNPVIPAKGIQTSFSSQEYFGTRLSPG